MRRPRRHGSQRVSAARSDRYLGLALGTIGVLIIGGLAFGAYWIKTTRTLLDPVTNCPVTGPKSVEVVIVDRSDPMTGQQAQIVAQQIQHLKGAAEAGDRFDFYTIEGEAGEVLSPFLQVCSPAKPEQANAVYQNPEKIRRAFEEKYAAAVDRVVGELLVQTTRPSSPIVESIRAAAITSFGPLDGGIPLRMLLISDMIQHSQTISQYRTDARFSEIAATSGWPSIRPDLKGAQVRILYVLRPGAIRGNSPIQSRGHQAFWEDLIRASGGVVTGIDPI